jgi:uncharacterized protein
MRSLVLVDDLWHPGAVPREGLSRLGEFDWIEDGCDWSAVKMAEYRVVILAKANNRSAAAREPWADVEVGDAFQSFVKEGGGLLIVHSGASGYEEIPSMRGLPAGAFLHHPPQCPVTVSPVNGHLLCTGVSEFTETDEHYFMHFDDLSADVFLHSSSPYGVQPAGWTRTVGAGRVCILTPGHNLSVWLNSSFQQLLQNCLAWVSNA